MQSFYWKNYDTRNLIPFLNVSSDNINGKEKLYNIKTLYMSAVIHQFHKESIRKTFKLI